MSDERRKCPDFGGKRCIKDQCVAWFQDQVEENGIAKVKFECSKYFWTPLYLRAIANRQDGTQRAVEGLRNYHAKVADRLGTLAQMASPPAFGDRKRLNGD